MCNVDNHHDIQDIITEQGEGQGESHKPAVHADENHDIDRDIVMGTETQDFSEQCVTSQTEKQEVKDCTHESLHCKQQRIRCQLLPCCLQENSATGGEKYQ